MPSTAEKDSSSGASHGKSSAGSDLIAKFNEQYDTITKSMFKDNPIFDEVIGTVNEQVNKVSHFKRSTEQEVDELLEKFNATIVTPAQQLAEVIEEQIRSKPETLAYGLGATLFLVSLRKGLRTASQRGIFGVLAGLGAMYYQAR